jgi:hypothetical protein
MKNTKGKIVPPYTWSDFPNDKMWLDPQLCAIGKRNIVLTQLLGGRIEPRTIDFEPIENHKDYVIVKISIRKEATK